MFKIYKLKKKDVMMKNKLMTENVCTLTDSYKLAHFQAYQPNLKRVYSYFESRKGAKFPYTVFFGLQFLLKEIEGIVFDSKDVDEAVYRAKAHFFGNPTMFNEAGWRRLLEKHGGILPIEIKAVEEGSVIPIDNVLFSVENTDDEFPWLTNYLESHLTHVWYPSVVATLSRNTKELFKKYLEKTADNLDILPWCLHDFGYRGVSSNQSAGRGGSGHLVNFLGTDTFIAMDYVHRFYNEDYENIGHSVFATEHSIMTSLGEDGELKIIEDILEKNPVGIVSIVSDSYDYYRNVKWVGSVLKQRIVDRFNNAPKEIPTKYVIRPDSCTPTHQTPHELVLWTFQQLEKDFGVTPNTKGYKKLPPYIGVIWGDGIDMQGIEKILEILDLNGYDTSTIVAGMGGGLLQKINRDTMRSAFKCSAQLQGEQWVDIQKNPLDKSKKSKAGKLALIIEDGIHKTIKESELNGRENLLKTVFLNGKIVKEFTFAEVRKNAELK